MNPAPGTVFIPPETIPSFLNPVPTKKMQEPFLWEILVRSHISMVCDKLPQTL